jgi:hypothetical protein
MSSWKNSKTMPGLVSGQIYGVLTVIEKMRTHYKFPLEYKDGVCQSI